jgi:hypothetical protein
VQPITQPVAPTAREAPPAGTTAAPPAAKPALEWTIEIPPLGVLHPGQKFTVTSNGLPAGTQLVVTMHSDPVVLLTAVLMSNPERLALVVPADLEPGAHTLVFEATLPDGEIVAKSAPVAVEPDAAELTTLALPDESSATRSGGARSQAAPTDVRTVPAAPSAISAGISSLQDIIERPFSLLAAGSLALLLIVLVALPTELLSSTLEGNTGRMGRGLATVNGALERAGARLSRATHSRAVPAVVLILLVSVILGFVDPEFGFDLVSLRLVLALALALFLLTYATAWGTQVILRRVWNIETEVSIQSWIAVLAVVGVLIARALDFSPGFLLGVAIGVELVRASRRAEVAAVLVQFGLVFALAITGWVGYSVLEAQGEPEDFLGALLNETFVALTAEGLIAILVAALPLQFLKGRRLWAESKVMWFGSFFIIAAAFSLLVLPTAAVTTTPDDIAVWALVLVGYAIITIGTWAVFAFLERRRRATGDAEREAETVDA